MLVNVIVDVTTTKNTHKIVLGNPDDDASGAIYLKKSQFDVTSKKVRVTVEEVEE